MLEEVQTINDWCGRQSCVPYWYTTSALSPLKQITTLPMLVGETLIKFNELRRNKIWKEGYFGGRRKKTRISGRNQRIKEDDGVDMIRAH